MLAALPLLALLTAPVAAPAGALFVRWPAAPAGVVPLLRSAGAPVLITTADADLGALRQAGVPFLLESDAAGAGELARRTRPAGLLLAGPEGAAEFASAHPELLVLALVRPGQLGQDLAPAYPVLAEGLWPGIHPVDPSQASATERPWVDSNLYLYAFLKGVYPRRPALVAYSAEAKLSPPYSTLALALAEARLAGGNVLLAPPEPHRRALLAGEARALAAWAQFGHVARFLETPQAGLSEPVEAPLAILAQDLEQAGELLNMTFRHNLAPRAAAVDQIPVGTRVLVAGGVAPRDAQALRRFAEAGGTLVAAPGVEEAKPWWQGWAAPGQKVRAADFLSAPLGRGRLLTYTDPLLDPAEFAYDMRRLVEPAPLRLWLAPSILGLVRAPATGGRRVQLINYGSTRREPALLRVAGHFARATLHRPNQPPAALKPLRRGAATEFELPGLEAAATLELLP